MTGAVWVVVGEHFEVPGVHIHAFATEAAAKTKASEMVIGMLEFAEMDQGMVAAIGWEKALDVLNDALCEDQSALVIVQRCEVEGASPIRIIVDMSGGVFQGAEATAPVDVMVVDCDDGESANALVPGWETGRSTDDVWAGIEAAEVDADAVNAAFDGIVWTDGENV